MAIKINSSKFFQAYRAEFGPLTQSLVDAFNELIPAIGACDLFGATSADRNKLAYLLATFKWETSHTFLPIHEFGGADYFNTRYGPGTKVGKKLGNVRAGDGARFHGRGYVQLTGRDNYARASQKLGKDFLNNPDLALDPALAFQIAAIGMTEGWFTSRKLSQYFTATKADYTNARAIINGSDKADLIAGLARRMDGILKVSI